MWGILHLKKNIWIADFSWEGEKMCSCWVSFPTWQPSAGPERGCPCQTVCHRPCDSMLTPCLNDLPRPCRHFSVWSLPKYAGCLFLQISPIFSLLHITLSLLRPSNLSSGQSHQPPLAFFQSTDQVTTPLKNQQWLPIAFPGTTQHCLKKIYIYNHLHKKV